MNKLVSKNPVLRFKEGRKLLKGADGLKANEYGELAYFLDRNGKVFKGHIDQSPENKRLTQRYTLNGEQYGSFDGGKLYYNLSSLKPLNYKSNQYLLSKINSPKKETTSETSDSTKGVITPVDNYYLKGFKNRKDEIAKLGGVRAVLKMLGFTAGNGLDGKWGQNTEEAYLKYLIANAAKTPSLEDTISAAQNLPILSTPTINPSEYTFTESQLSGLGENPYYEPYPELRFNNFDRTQTRQWLRDNGFNPYSLTGALRKALRMILNGLGTDEDKNLIGLTNGLSEILTNYKYLKQGGLLPSRNIVKRFKLQKGNKLPNAPKAEDRYKDGKKYIHINPNWDNSTPDPTRIFKGVKTKDIFPGEIVQSILYSPLGNAIDTTYFETPPSWLPVKKVTRAASSLWKSPLYDTLKQRFDTAWNLAK